MKKPAKKSAKRTVKPTTNTVLILRTVAADMRSPDEAIGGVAAKSFAWPKRGNVECKNWNPAPVCGGGLHGLRWGVGNVDLLYHEDATRLWLVIEANAADVVDVGSDKCKCRRGTVLFCGDRVGAVALVQSRAPKDKMVVFGTATAGNYGTATAGYSGTATAGNYGTATAGDSGTATAGYSGTATAGDSGTATAGNYGTATAGYSGTATAGELGCLSLLWWDGQRYRRAIFAVGEDGIEPNVAYRVDDRGKPVRVEKSEAAK